MRFLLVLFLTFVAGAGIIVPQALATENVELTPATLDVISTVELSESFGLFNNVRHSMNTSIVAVIPEIEDSGENRTLRLLVSQNLRVEEVSITPSSTYTIAFWSRFFNEMIILIPDGVSEYSVNIIYSFDGDSVFMRNTANIPRVVVSSNSAPFTPTSITILIPRSSEVRVINLSENEMIPIESSGINYYGFINPSGVEVFYENSDRILTAFFFVGLVFTSSLSISFLLTRERFFQRVSAAKSLFSRALNKLTPHDVSSTLLALYVTTAILMLTLSLAFGPAPTPRVYLSATPETAPEIIPFINEAGFSYITPDKGVGQLDVMASLGSYDAAIVADFTPAYRGGEALPGLGSLRQIFILTTHAPEEFVETAQRIWGSSVTLIDDPSELVRLLRVPSDRNQFGIRVDQVSFAAVAAILGILSFVIAFLATSALSSRIMFRASTHPSPIASIIEVIAFSVMIFMFTQMIYMASAVLLKLPLGLHAGNPDITAIGYLGFGGGSRPRMAAAALGFIVGILLTREGRQKFDMPAALAGIIAGLFLVLDPLQGGLVFHQFLVSFTTSFVAPSTGQTINLVKGFIGETGRLWTSDLSSSYFIQRGVPLFYAGTMGMALYPRLGRFVATFTLLIGSFVASLGFMRIADQVPVKALASIPPGLLLGFMVIPLLMVLSYFELTARKQFRD